MTPPGAGAPAKATAAHPSDRHFATDHLVADLKRRSARGGAITVLNQACKFTLQMGSTMVLARLLTPADFGLIAMVTAFTGFVGLFKDLGLSMATVQRSQVNHRQASTLFWINVAVSVLLMLVTIALAPLVVWVYDQPELLAVTMCIGTTFIFVGLAAQHMALLRRQMRYLTIGAVDIGALAAGIGTAVVLAWHGAGYWALVGLLVVQWATNMVLAWIASPWRPGMPRLESEVGAMVRFGGYLTGFNTLNYFTRHADNFMIGFVWGAGPLGIYVKAYSLLLLPLKQLSNPLSSVAVATLSRLQHKPDAYRRSYTGMLRALCYLTMPGVVLLAVLADDVVLVILGQQWLAVADIFQVLAIVGLYQPMMTATGWAMISLGRTDRMLRWMCVQMPCAVTAFAIGVFWGPMGMAIATAICATLLLVPNMMYAFHRTPITLGVVGEAVRRPVLLAATVALAAKMCVELSEHWHVAPRFGLALAAAAIVAMLLVGLYPPMRRDGQNVLKVLRRK